MKAHEEDLRVEVEKELTEPTADVTWIPGQGDGAPRAQVFAADIAAQGSEAAPTIRLRALLQYAERLALRPGEMDANHVQALRDAGYDDTAIHDAAQVVAYFSYINRIADGLGVDLEPEMQRPAVER